MSLNFDGLGFSFAAKDEGLLDYAKKIKSTFESITEQAAKLGSSGGGMQPPSSGGPGGPGGGGGGPGGNKPEGPGGSPDPSADMAAKIQKGMKNFEGYVYDATIFGLRAVMDFTTKGVRAIQDFASAGIGYISDFSVFTVKSFFRLGVGAVKSLFGLRTVSKKVTDQLYGMADVGNKLRAILGQLRLGNLLEGLSLSGLNDIKDAMDKLGSQGRNLTTSVEDSFVSMGKSAKASFANYGLAGDQIKKLSGQAAGMARGMNADIGQTTEALAVYATKSASVASLGVKSASDLVKINAVFGISTKDLSLGLTSMSKAYGINDADLEQLTKTTANFGQVQNDVGGAMNKLPELMAKLSQTTDRYGNLLRGADLANFAKETLALSAGFVKIGYTGDQAAGASEAFADAIAKGRKDYASLFIKGGEMPGLLEELAISSGSFQDAFALMEKGPKGFAEGMTEMMKVVKSKAGPEGAAKFLRTVGVRLGETLGPEQAAMLQDFMAKADDGVKKVMDGAMNATQSLADMSKAGYSSGITLARSFEMAEEDFITSFRNISRSSSQTFVKDAREQFKIFGGQLKDISKQDGPMGDVVRKLSEMHQLGASALLPKGLAPAAALFGSLLKEIGPTLGILGSLGFRFSMLLSPLTALAAPLAMLAITFGSLVMQTYDATTHAYDFGKAWDMLKEKVNGWIEKIPGIWTAVVSTFKKVGSFLLTAVPPIFEAAVGLAIKAWDKLVAWFDTDFPGLVQDGLSIGKDIGNWIGAQFDKIPWAKIGKSVYHFFHDVLPKWIKGAVETGIDIAGWIGGKVSALPWSDIWAAAVNFLREDVPALFRAALTYGIRFKDWIMGYVNKIPWAAIWSGAVNWFKNDLPVLIHTGLVAAVNFSAWLLDLVNEIKFDGLGTGFFDKFSAAFSDEGAGTKLLSNLKGIFEGLATPLLQALTAMIQSIDWPVVGDTIAKGFSDLWDVIFKDPIPGQARSQLAVAFGGLVDAAWKATKGLASGLWTKLKEEFGLIGASGIVLAVALASPFGAIVQQGLVMAVTKIVWPLVITPLWTAFSGWIATLMAPMILTVTTFFSSMWASAMVLVGASVETTVGAAFGMALKGALKFIFTKVPFIGPLIATVFDFEELAALFNAGKFAEGFGRLVWDVINGFLLGIPGLIGDFFGIDIAGAFQSGMASVSNAVSSFFGLAASKEQKAYEDMMKNRVGRDGKPLAEGTVTVSQKITPPDTTVAAATALTPSFTAASTATDAWTGSVTQASTATSALFPVIENANKSMSTTSDLTWNMADGMQATAFSMTEFGTAAGTLPLAAESFNMFSEQAGVMAATLPTGLSTVSDATTEFSDKLVVNFDKLSLSAQAVSSSADGIQGAFTTAYKDLTPKTAKFYETYTAGFKLFSLSLKNIFNEVVIQMLKSMDLMTTAVMADSAVVDAKINQMTAKLVAARKEQDRTLEMAASAGPSEAVKTLAGMNELPDSMKILAEYVNEPYWYRQYEAIFIAKMNVLTTAVQAIQVGNSAPTGKPGKGGNASRQTAAAMK